MCERWISGMEGENVKEYSCGFINGRQVQDEEKFWV
jgi:hypothetical protein